MKRMKPPKGEPHSDYHKIWRQVDGIIRQTFSAHPEYLTEHGRKNARLSLTKRIAGQLSNVKKVPPPSKREGKSEPE